MRHLSGHIVNPCNDKLKIAVEDKPGAGGAYYRYVISGFQVDRNPSADDFTDYPLCIVFQNGPILENGTNGITHEALLAIVIDRLECFQAGPYANDYSQQALNHLREAQTALQARTRERMARGVEGTNQK